MKPQNLVSKSLNTEWQDTSKQSTNLNIKVASTRFLNHSPHRRHHVKRVTTPKIFMLVYTCMLEECGALLRNFGGKEKRMILCKKKNKHEKITKKNNNNNNKVIFYSKRGIINEAYGKCTCL